MTENVTIDLSNYKDKVGSRVTPGRYRVLVEDAELTQSAAGNPMINLWFRVQGGDFDGATIVDRLTQTENALFRTVAFMQAIGMPTPRKRLQINLRQFVGKVLDIDVEDGDPYNGRVKSEVRGYLKVEKDTSKTGASDDLDLLEEFTIEEEEAKPNGKSKAGKKAAKDEDVDLENVDLG